MMIDAEIEQLLERLGKDWPTESSLVNGVMRRIESETASVEPKRTKRSGVKLLLALAASLAVIASLWWALHSERNLYAQAIEGIKKANTVALTATASPEPGKPAEVSRKAWYERSVGFREELGSEIRLGNRNYFWTFLKDSNLAIRTQSRDIDDLLNRMLDSDSLQELKQAGEVERYAAGDQSVDGQLCRAYLLTKLRGTEDPEWIAGQRRSVILLDDQSRIRRFTSEVQSNDVWSARMTVDWKYDVPVDRALFEPNFGNNVKIVDADKVFDAFVDLETATYREERAGLWFAIHHLEKFDGGIFVISSVRGTKATLEKYPLKRRMMQPGRFFAEGPAANWKASPQGNGYFTIDLARADHEGINVCWWVLIPRGVPLSNFNSSPGMVKLPVGITPNGNFAKDNFSKEGVIQHLFWDIELKLPEAAAPTSLETIAARVYADQVALEFIPFRQLDLGPKDNVEQISRVESTTVEKFSQAVAAHIQYWQAGDVEFQLQGQFESSPVQDDAAIGLSYEPMVDDATLARVAKHGQLKRLYLDGTKITDAGLKQLIGLKELRELSLSHTSITDEGLKELERIQSLRSLNVTDTKVTPAGIARLVVAIPALKVKQ